MSSKSKSSSKQSTSTTQQDNRVTADGGAVVASGSGNAVTSTALKDQAFQFTQGDGNVVNLLDGEVIKAAFDFAKTNASQTSDLTDAIFAANSAALNTGASILDKAAEAADPTATERRAQMLIYAGLGVLAMFLLLPKVMKA